MNPQVQTQTLAGTTVFDAPFTTAQEILLTPYSLDDKRLQTVFGEIMTHRVDYADLYFQYSRSESWSLEEGIVKSGSFNIDQGVGVRAVSGEKTAFAYSDDISLDALQSAAEATRAIARAGQTGGVQVVKRGRRRNLLCAAAIRCRASGPGQSLAARAPGAVCALARQPRDAGDGVARRRIRGRAGRALRRPARGGRAAARARCRCR